MRPYLTMIPLAIAIGLASHAAGAREMDGRTPTGAEAAHARRMVRALDDYDAQLARRIKQLEAERRAAGRRR